MSVITRVGARRVLAGATVLALGAVLVGCRLEFTIEPLTTDVDGTGTNDGTSDEASFSPDGTAVVFTSEASDLGPTDANGRPDVYVHDLGTRTTSLVSVNTAGQASAGGGREPRISPDGTKVLFISGATDLGPPVSLSSPNVYVRDLVAGTTALISRNPDGTDSGGGRSGDAVFSPDGTKVAFVSTGHDFGPPDPTGPLSGDDERDVLLHDLATGSTVLVSATATGDDGGNARSESPVFSPDGNALYFVSEATDLGTVEPHGHSDLYRYDMATGEVTLVSTSVDGEGMAGGVVGEPLVSPDSRWLAFVTNAADLGPTDTNGARDVYMRDLTTGEMVLVTANGDGTDSAAGPSEPSSLEFDGAGTKLLYTTSSSDLGPTDTNDRRDVYLYDVTTGENELVSVNADGDDSAEQTSYAGAFGRGDDLVAFVSLAGDLGPEDDNEGYDMYVRDLNSGVVSILSPTAGEAVWWHGSTYTGCLCRIYDFRPDGHGLLFGTYYAEVLVDDGSDNDYDLFIAEF